MTQGHHLVDGRCVLCGEQGAKLVIGECRGARDPIQEQLVDRLDELNVAGYEALRGRELARECAALRRLCAMVVDAELHGSTARAYCFDLTAEEYEQIQAAARGEEVRP